MKRYVMEASPLGPSRKVKAAVRKAVKEINALPGEELSRLERLFLSKYGVGNESVVFADSLKELLFVICRRLQPRNVLIIGPALNIYREAALASGAAIESIPASEEGSFSPDVEELGKRSGKCDLVFIANPNRITGTSLSSAVLDHLFAGPALKDCVTVIDESLIDFTGHEGFIRSAARSSKSIVLRTTACYFGLPGLELACAVAGPMISSSLREGLQSYPSIPALAAARTALRDMSYKRLTEQFMKEEKSLLIKAIGRMPGLVPYDSDTNVYLLKAPDTAPEIARRAYAAGLAVELCPEIEGLKDQFLRVSVMKHDHNLKLIKLLKRVITEKADNRSRAG